jgi:hypothetical protein
MIDAIVTLLGSAIFAKIVYLLGSATCLACAALLLRGWRRTSARLLLWSGLCFLALALNNALLYVDGFIVLDHDLRLLNDAVTLVGVCLLLYGLIWDTRE